MKFGGTSVGKPERMYLVGDLITRDTESKIVVLSALSGTTNSLIEISNLLALGNKEGAKKNIQKLEIHYKNFVIDLLQKEEFQAKAYAIVEEHFDFLNIILKISFSEALNKDILAQGELMSTKLFSVYLEEKEIPHLLLPALDFMTIDGNEEPQLGSIKVKLNKILKQHSDKKLFITQGYICKNARGEIDNLKRGGSDYTASIIGAAIHANEVQIWTDIDGMHNNDPRIVSKTHAIKELSFDEAAELAYFGAKILHPASIWPAQHFNIPVTNIIGEHFNGKEANATKEAILENSGFLNGLLMKDAIGVAINKIEELGIGKRKVNFKMRDAGFSRQRYWGEPFPIVWKDGMATALNENDLPLQLPHVEKYSPGPEGEGPLANISDWVNLPSPEGEGLGVRLSTYKNLHFVREVLLLYIRF
mgnify:CR=1 FL=1